MQKQISNLDKLTLSNDFLFKHVMLRKRICKHILEELLHTEIADITYLEAEQTVEKEILEEKSAACCKNLF